MSGAGGARLRALAGVVANRRPGAATIVVQPLPGAPLVSVTASYAAGSRHDPPGQSGLAHLTEHLVFGGGGASAAGGASGGTVGLDRARFRATVLAADWRRALTDEAARSGASLRPSLDRLAVERRVLVHERATRDGGAAPAGERDAVQALLFPPGHPYHRPVIGRAEELASIGEADVEEFHRRRYAAAAAIAVVGDVDPEAVLREVSAASPAEAWPVAPAEAAPPLAPERVEGTLSGPGECARVWIAFALPGDGSPELPLLEVVGRALAIGSACALACELAPTGAAAGFGAYLTRLRDASLFGIRATAAPGVDAAALRDALLAALRRVVDRGLADADLAQARAKATTDFLSVLQRPSRRAEHFAEAGDAPEGLVELAERGERYGAVEAGAAGDALERLWEARRACLLVDCAAAAAPAAGSGR